jgi:nucleoside-diphosphate-sugar epimerase
MSPINGTGFTEKVLSHVSTQAPTIPSGSTEREDFIVRRDEPILITGATGFIGMSLVKNLLERGFRNLRCFARLSGSVGKFEALAKNHPGARVEVITGNLLSREDSNAAAKDVAVIFHLATGKGGKSYPDAFLNSVVTTRNLLEATVRHNCLRRFVNVSSFAVYTNTSKAQRRLLDESCPVEKHAELRDAYCFAKMKQDEIVFDYGQRFGIPYVIVRPGSVFGPGKADIPGRVGIDTFGIFLHLGGSNQIPFTYIDNCADAIAIAGLKRGIDGGIFNIIDDELPTSRHFLRQYKKNVKDFKSFYVPHFFSYAFCYLWEWYSRCSEGQLEPAFSRRRWHAFWKKTRYSNSKLKALGWTPKVSMAEAFQRYFQAGRNGGADA